MNKIVKRIGELRFQLARERFARGRQRAIDKRKAESMKAEITLLLDDLKAEGVDISSPDGQRIFAQLLHELAGGPEEAGELTDGDRFMDIKPEEPF
jgi:hypothetical protein